MDRIGRYIFEREIGRGGFGRVVLARDPDIGRSVAIKLLLLGTGLESDPTLLARFRAEAQTTASLQHPNIVTILEFGEHQGTPFIAMEYLDGQTLQSAIDDGALLLPAKMRTMMQVSAGLQYAHSRGIIHRDIKPGNIMRLADENVKIMDFGIARLADAKTSFTQSGMLIGSYSYMAPELFDGVTADALTDLFSFGVVYYELLSGRAPFRGATPASKIWAVKEGQVTPLPELMSHCPPELDFAIGRALSPKRENRYQSLEEMDFDLRPILLDLQKGEAEAYAKDAERLLEQDRLTEAKSAQRKALALDPLNRRAAGLRESLRRKEWDLSVRPKLRQLVEQAASYAQKQDLATAERCYQEALALDPGSQSTRVKLEQLQEQIRKQSAAAKLLREAQGARDSGNLTAARHLAEAALGSDPSNSMAAEFLADLEGSLRKRDERQVIEGVIEQVRSLATVDAKGAGRLLAESRERLGNRPEFESLKKELMTLIAAEERRAAVHHGVADANRLLSSSRFGDAIAGLEALARKHGDDPAIAALLKVARERAEAASREKAIAEALNRAGILEEREDFGGALRIIQQAAQNYPGQPELSGALNRLVAKSKAREQTQQQTSVSRAESHKPVSRSPWRIGIPLAAGALAALGLYVAFIRTPNQPEIEGPLSNPVADKPPLTNTPVTGGDDAMNLLVAPSQLRIEGRDVVVRRPIAIQSARAGRAGEVRARTNAGWLRVSGQPQPLPATFDVDLDPRGLAPGSYQGEVLIEDVKGTGAIRVTAQMVVTADASKKKTEVAKDDRSAEMLRRTLRDEELPRRGEKTVDKPPLPVEPKPQPVIDNKTTTQKTTPPPPEPPKVLTCPEPKGDLGQSNQVLWVAGPPLEPGQTVVIANQGASFGRIGTKPFPGVPFDVTGIQSMPPGAVSVVSGPSAASCWGSITVRNTSSTPVQRIAINWSRK